MKAKALTAVFYVSTLVTAEAVEVPSGEAARGDLKDIAPSALQSSVLGYGERERAEFARFEPVVSGKTGEGSPSGKEFPASSAQSEVLKKR